MPVAGDPGEPLWVTAVTLGYTHVVASGHGVELGLGAAATRSFLPSELRGSYGGDLWSGKLFVQLSGMGMWSL